MTGGATGCLRWLVVFSGFLPVNLAVYFLLSPQLTSYGYFPRLALEAAVINTAMLYVALPAARTIYRPWLPGGRGLPGRPWQQWVVCYLAFTPVRGITGVTALPALTLAGLDAWAAVAVITAAMSLVMGSLIFPAAFKAAGPWLRRARPRAHARSSRPRATSTPSGAAVIMRDGSILYGASAEDLQAARQART